MIVYIGLLYFASHTGRKISKLALAEEEYLRAITVRGHFPLNISNTIPSSNISPMHIQMLVSILLANTAAYSK
ncbi:hypothetical protein SAMN04488505_108220 [Chitinophaga rupis]|uniref:Uncharacterized protein n=1 Tax=Chitinophaga rupis TaxID=573321 RepID=A0A1H8EAS4_9BACT|nr:hypothetical protein SAMN04488505_108220 [Chitinophaga rupis]